MNLSDFLLNKKIVFEKGIPVEYIPELEGDIEFYNLNLNRLKLINENVISKLEGTVEDERLIYEIIPFISNLNKDVSYEQFKNEILDKKEFLCILDMLMNITNDIFEYAKKSQELTDKSNELKTNFESFGLQNKIPQAPIKTKEEEIEELFRELSLNIHTKEKRDEILNQINKLRDEG